MVPTRFAMLSDRLVNQNGILIMGGISLVMMILSGGSVRFLVVLYSINVFMTFSLSQLGMVRHWWNCRTTDTSWKKGLGINGLGLLLTSFILVSVIILKFEEGGWITLVVTGSLVAIALCSKKHYANTPNCWAGWMSWCCRLCLQWLMIKEKQKHRLRIATPMP